MVNTIPVASDVEAATFEFMDAPEANRPPVALDDTPNGVGIPVVANPGAPLVTFVGPASALATMTPIRMRARPRCCG